MRKTAGIIQNCSNAAALIYGAGAAAQGTMGGIAAVSTADILNCYNTGEITGNAALTSAGGIAGIATAYIRKSRNFGDISVTEGSPVAGGIVGSHWGSIPAFDITRAETAAMLRRFIETSK